MNDLPDRSAPARVRAYSKPAAERAVMDLLEAFGEDTDRSGIADTPKRVAKAWAEMLAGYDEDPLDVLKTSSGKAGFDEGRVDQMVVIAGIEFTSVCEHHLLPFTGEADVGYLPNPAAPIVVGASKIPRLVLTFARRLQVQERLTQQVADAMDAHLSPLGVGVRVRATHLCMVCRGVHKRAPMGTEVLLGRFREPEIRAEFWELSRYAAQNKP